MGTNNSNNTTDKTEEYIFVSGENQTIDKTNRNKLRLEINANSKLLNRILINGINTVWCYLDDFKNMSQEDVDLLLYKGTDEYHNEQLDKNRSKRKTDDKKVICLTTGEIFDNCREAAKKYNNGIYHCLKDKLKTCGKHPITGEKLRWDYYKE